MVTLITESDSSAPDLCSVPKWTWPEVTTSWGSQPNHYGSGHFHHLPTTHSGPVVLSAELGLAESDHFFGEQGIELEKWSL
ncbi:MAG: hypothetical protein LBH48_00295 [Bifidobacteriaceae bacterium]|jgi:hypothetical protein|nr:hypothetical protein [Bifidobacteriaceae bacterium]